MTKTETNLLSDEDLVKHIVESNKHDSFGLLYDRYATKVFHKCISFVKDSDEAQDLVHDIFVKTFVSLSKFSHQSKFSTWLYSLTYNFCVDYLRKKNKVILESEDKLINIADDEDEKNQRELMAIEGQKLMRVLDEIPSDDKVLLLMKYQDDTPVKEIMEVMDLSESAVKMRVKRARERAVKAYKTLFSHAG